MYMMREQKDIFRMSLNVQGTYMYFGTFARTSSNQQLIVVAHREITHEIRFLCACTPTSACTL